MKKLLWFCKWLPVAVFVILFQSFCTNPDDTEKKLDTLFNSFFPKDEPGGAVLIAQNGRIIYSKGFGIADLKTKEAITPNTLFNTGSVSKTFVANGILKLAEENKLSLEDDLYKYFPDFRDSSIAKKVKLHHLLTHTSGLPDIRKVSDDSVFYLTAKDEENWGPIKQTERLEFEPGSKFNYSNPAFNALALVIEKVSGIKWQEYIRKNIMEVSGMKTSTITDGPHPESGVSHGYIFNAAEKKFFEKDYGEEPTFAASGNGGVWSSVNELWLYEQAVQQNKFLGGEWIKKSRTVYKYSNWMDTVPGFIGLSWFLTTFGNNKLEGHTGSQGGFRADYVWVPDKKVFYVILTNTPKALTRIRKSVFEILEL